MPTYRDSAVVLRAVKLGEADRIVTLLARRQGCVRAVARGVRRTSSRIGARLEPGSVVDLQCYRGRNLDTVTQVVTVANYGAAVSGDYARWTSAQAIIETAERLVAEGGQQSAQHFALLAGALRALADGDRDSGLVLDSYLLRAMALSGWSPSFRDCAACGEFGPHRVFNIAHGGCLCSECARPGSSRPSAESLQLMGALLEGDWPRAVASRPGARTEAAGMTAAYLQWHLERRLRALPFVER